jgi:hypothetical protein
MSDLCTPFRDHYEHSRTLDCEKQLEECADYVQHPEVLFTEFLESYYLVEREADPLCQDAFDAEHEEELVLEIFHDALQLDIIDEGGERQRMLCAGGAFDPLPAEQHPALRRRGLDYVAMRDGSSRIVLGVTEAQQEATVYPLLLRALNCFAEIAPPFQLARLRRLVVRDRIEPDATFDLQIGLSKRPCSEAETALRQLTRDLAEAFKIRILEHPQFEGTLGGIECLDLDAGSQGLGATLRLAWRI